MGLLPSITFTRIVLGLFLAYVVNVGFVIYNLFKPQDCVGDNRKCLTPAFQFPELAKLKVSVYVSRSSSASRTSAMELAWDSGDSSILEKHDTLVNVTLPFQTRRNGSLFAFVFVHPIGKSPFEDIGEKSTLQQYTLSRYIVPKDKEFNLIQGNKQENGSGIPITHVFPRINIYLSTQQASFDRFAIPGDVYHLLKLDSKGKYLPLLYIDGLSSLQRHLVPVNKDTEKVPMKIYFTPVSLGRLRVWSSVEQTLGNMKNLGFTENDLDDMKGIFSDTNLYFLGMTFSIAIVHMLFDVLAFKNDISFWKQKDTMEGMSMRTVFWRFISSTIVFLYLLDEKTSLLVLVPSGIGTVIELWKVTKALKIKVSWTSWLPSVSFGEKSDSERVTEEFDEQAMRYLSYLLYPLLVGVAVYSLMYQPHKSWYSWIVRSLVNGVYAFGFLFMLPQLFVNYKLKSVAHLPWRAFTYKAFNTFIDDVFAFIIVMPTAHRVACFRDDAVFLVYLYQRWLYPVDKTRANEYGMVFEEKKVGEGALEEVPETTVAPEEETKKDK